MNAKAEYGGAANHQGFSYAVAAEGVEPQIVPVTPIIDKDA